MAFQLFFHLEKNQLELFGAQKYNLVGMLVWRITFYEATVKQYVLTLTTVLQSVTTPNYTLLRLQITQT